MTDTLEEIARETAARLIPHTTSVHNVNVIADAIRQAQSARLPEDVALTVSRCRVSAKIADEDSQPVYAENFAEAADTIEQQAAEIARLKEENKALGIADAHHFDEYAELKARAEAAEARIVELTEKLAECDDDSFRHVIRQRDEARAQVTALTKERDGAIKASQDWVLSAVEARAERDALTAENTVLRSAIEYAHSEGFNWPTDPLSTPNTKAMRMVEVVKAARNALDSVLIDAHLTLDDLENPPFGKSVVHIQWDAVQRLAAALDGEQG